MTVKASDLRTWGWPQHLKDGAAVGARRAAPLPNPYLGGYGWKIPMPYEVQLKDGRWRRVYASSYANASRLWVTVCGDDCTLDIDTETMLDDLRHDS